MIGDKISIRLTTGALSARGHYYRETESAILYDLMDSYVETFPQFESFDVSEYSSMYGISYIHYPLYLRLPDVSMIGFTMQFKESTEIGSIIKYGAFKFPVLYIQAVTEYYEAAVIKVCTEIDLETSTTERNAPLSFNYGNIKWVFHQGPYYTYVLKLFQREDFWE